MPSASAFMGLLCSCGFPLILLFFSKFYLFVYLKDSDTQCYISFRRTTQ